MGVGVESDIEESVKSPANSSTLDIIRVYGYMDNIVMRPQSPIVIWPLRYQPSEMLCA